MEVILKQLAVLFLIVLLGACVPAPITAPTPKAPSPTLTSVPTIVAVVPTATLQPTATPTAPPAPTQTPVPVRVSAKQTVNVRQGPGTQFAIVGKLQPNTNVVALGKNEDGQWLQVALPDATNPGWVSISVVSVNGATASLQIVVPSPTTTRAVSLATKTPTTKTVARVAAQVSRLVDGDTMEVVMGGKSYTVRYIGIDTPETIAPNTPVQWMGKEASAENKSLVEGKTVYLEKDVSETDKYGRLLRYVYVGNLFVNAELVRKGYAKVSTYPPDVKYQSLFLQMQQEARAANRGLWGAAPTSASQPVALPQSGNCYSAYPDVCIPPSPPDLDCKDIPYRRFRVLPPDPHRFDGDKDGVGCES